jgi:NAD(P)H-flavin reductase
VLVRLEVPEDTFRQYQVPGQYVQIRPQSSEGDEETKPLFLAMASPPPPSTGKDENDPSAPSFCFDFLVKKTPNNGWITSSGGGKTAVQVSQVLGSGFPTEENLEGFKYDFPTQNVLLFAAGSGIGPIKAALESGRLGVDGGGGRTARLYYGERTSSDLCFVDHFANWEGMGYEVVPVLSQPDDSWEGRSGYVQNALEEDGVAIPRNSGALIVGMKGMAEAVKSLLVSAGVFDGRVLFNF